MSHYGNGQSPGALRKQPRHDRSFPDPWNLSLPDTRNNKTQNPLKKYRVGIVGATGAVGKNNSSSRGKGNSPSQRPGLLASAKSAGREIQACGSLETVKETTPDSFRGLDFAIFSAGSQNSEQFAEIAREQGCVVIDNSSAFRMDLGVRWSYPEINGEVLESHRGLIANPNCSTSRPDGPLPPPQALRA